MIKETRIDNVEKAVFSISGSGKTVQLISKRMKLEFSLKLHTKINSKWIKGMGTRERRIGSLRFVDTNSYV